MGEAVGRITTDAEGVVVCCPRCDAAGKVRKREGENTHLGDPDHDFACDDCGATFNVATVRATKNNGPKAAYSDLSPEDVGLGG